MNLFNLVPKLGILRESVTGCVSMTFMAHVKPTLIAQGFSVVYMIVVRYTTFSRCLAFAGSMPRIMFYSILKAALEAANFVT